MAGKGYSIGARSRERGARPWCESDAVFCSTEYPDAGGSGRVAVHHDSGYGGTTAGCCLRRSTGTRLEFLTKAYNENGLQLADLVAYPVARWVIKPRQPNRAFDILQSKFYRDSTGKVSGYGIKVFP